MTRTDFSRFSLAVMMVAGLGLLAACSSKPPVKTEPSAADLAAASKKSEIPTTKVDANGPGFGAGNVSAQDANKDRVISSMGDSRYSDVHFDYDDASIKASELDVLVANSELLRKQTRAKVTLEGHCDERGTESYNMALGMKRADAVKRHLVSLGVNEGQLSAISYGMAMPLDPGHNEKAWAANRRVHFKVQ